jgi:hypothetical protein
MTKALLVLRMVWPFLKTVWPIIADGKITREELYLVVDQMVDQFDPINDQITLWK